MIFKKKNSVKKANRQTRKGKGIMMVIQRKHIVLVALIIMIVVAGYLNWEYRNEMESIPTIGEYGDEEITVAKKLGEAQLVNNGVDESDDSNQPVIANTENSGNYFVEARMDKESTRSEALELLRSIVENEKSPNESKVKAQEELIAIAKNIDKEGAIENLIKAKGFKDALVFINEGNVNVVVKTDGLIQTQAAQIQDIVISQTGVSADKIKIVPVK